LGKKYLMTALNFSWVQLAHVLAETLAKIEMLELDMNGVRLKDEYHEFIKNAFRADF